MTEVASERWVEDLTETAEIGGQNVAAALTFTLDHPATLRVTRHHATRHRAQGLAIHADHTLSCGDVANDRLVLWSDTSPEHVDIEADAGTITIWNVWSEEGVVHAWIGAAGIQSERVDGDDNHWRINANDGHHADDHLGPTIDLEIELEILRRS